MKLGYEISTIAKMEDKKFQWLTHNHINLMPSDRHAYQNSLFLRMKR